MKKSQMNSEKNSSRRTFLRHAGFGAAALAGLPALSGACKEQSAGDKGGLSTCFARGDTVLFQGDSITDAGREKKKELPNNPYSFGSGYAYIIAARLLSELADQDLTLYNRGISGNKVFQLADRWEKDCLELEPDVLSILIGVNDYWHLRQGRYEGTPEIYERDYRELLNRTREAMPEIRLVLCQPFVLPETSAVDESWLQPFKAYQDIAAGLAKEFGAVWVPFQEAFDNALSMAPAVYWTEDGVHPSLAGCRIMAEAWLKAVCGES